MEYKTSEATREGNRRRNKRWRENNPEHVKELDRQKSRAHYHRHSEEVKAKMRARANARWAAMSPEERKDKKLRESYGIGLVEWTAILEAQDHKCAICRTDEPGTRGWQTDHCHTKGHVRGLLCVPCNTALGLVKESEEVLQAIIDYLKK